MKVRVSMLAAVIAMTPAIVEPQTPAQAVQDEYAVYDLLAPASGTFKTIYEVAVTSSGATEFRDRIGSGLTPVAGPDDGAIDLMTGAALKFAVEGDALHIQLARTVPADGGQARLRITKTYRDAVSYRSDGNIPVFSRRIPLPRAAIVLPAGYQLLECNMPSQVLTDPDGRIRISFMNSAFGRGRSVGGGSSAVDQSLARCSNRRSGEAESADERAQLGSAAIARSDRTRAIDGTCLPGSRYRLLSPAAGNSRVQPVSRLHRSARGHRQIFERVRISEMHRLESLPAESSTPVSWLPGEILTGAQLKAAGIDAGGESVAADQQVVVTRFPPVKKGQSLRLRLSETLYSAAKLSVRWRRADFRAEPRPSAKLSRLAARLAPDRTLDSRRDPADRRWADQGRFRQRPAGFD